MPFWQIPDGEQQVREKVWIFRSTAFFLEESELSTRYRQSTRQVLIGGYQSGTVIPDGSSADPVMMTKASLFRYGDEGLECEETCDLRGLRIVPSQFYDGTE